MFFAKLQYIFLSQTSQRRSKK